MVPSQYTANGARATIGLMHISNHASLRFGKMSVGHHEGPLQDLVWVNPSYRIPRDASLSQVVHLELEFGACFFDGDPHAYPQRSPKDSDRVLRNGLSR
jgi:hypothetical protein